MLLYYSGSSSRILLENELQSYLSFGLKMKKALHVLSQVYLNHINANRLERVWINKKSKYLTVVGESRHSSQQRRRVKEWRCTKRSQGLLEW